MLASERPRRTCHRSLSCFATTAFYQRPLKPRYSLAWGGSLATRFLGRRTADCSAALLIVRHPLPQPTPPQWPRHAQRGASVRCSRLFCGLARDYPPSSQNEFALPSPVTFESSTLVSKTSSNTGRRVIKISMKILYWRDRIAIGK